MSDQPTTEHADLRDQIADAFDAEPCFSPVESACVALRVVRPVLDRQAAEIKRLNKAIDIAKGWIKDWSRDNELVRRELNDQMRRAERAEAELAGLRALHQQIGDLAT